MRVIAGSAGGLPLTVPKSVTRPTTDRVREALFSSLGDRVLDAAVLDLYAGSGALGIEALSRGAASVVFVEADERACETIRGNLERSRLAGLAAEVRRSRVLDYLKRLPAGETGRFDLVFADPPYARDADTAAELAALLQSEPLAAALREGGLFVLESLDAGELPWGQPPRWELSRERRYGGTRLNYLRPLAAASRPESPDR
ncbi:MAG: 16S rRNA (guanine(966)-N(2))-methyltransferase RsmD [Verrucomicrobiales bacterium]|nr:16S rRNA (guanine(966)-N(2))-methyltransferase RsmD [Verrucomicrobiales bacterium]